MEVYNLLLAFLLTSIGVLTTGLMVFVLVCDPFNERR